MKMKKILTIVTNEDQFEKVGFRTGLWLGELTHFWDVAEEAGYSLHIASPKGGKVPLDPESLIISKISHTMGITGDVTKRYEDRAFMDLLNNSLKISDLDAKDYDAIYLTGGHGVMFDFPDDPDLAKRKDAVPFNMEEEIIKRGGKYSTAALPFNSHIVADGLLITGQNPKSAKGVGKKVVEKLGEMK